MKYIYKYIDIDIEKDIDIHMSHPFGAPTRKHSSIPSDHMVYLHKHTLNNFISVSNCNPR